MNIQTPFSACAYTFPHPDTADEDGLVAVGGDLNPYRLVEAYKNGIFPWFSHEGLIFWYSPDPRAVLYPNEFKGSKSLFKSVKNSDFEFKINGNFDEVIDSCRMVARKGEYGSWIDDDFIEGYTRLNRLGIAQSVECYAEGEIVGGFYGVRLGGVFFGESMFHKRRDASKAALWFLCENAKSFGIDIIDCQQETPHLLSLGAKAIQRGEFLEILKEKIQTSDMRG